jgi:hypothetical protein
MKYLLSIIFLFVISFTNAQVLDSVASKAKQVVTTTGEAVKDGVTVIDTSSNFKHIYTDIKTGVTALAQGLKVGVEHVYMVLVKQQIVKAIVWVLIGFIPLIIFLIFGKAMWNWADRRYNESDGFSVFIAIVFYLFTIVPSFFLMFNIDTVVTGFVNPEYGAIQQIISIVKTGNLEKQCETCK